MSLSDCMKKWAFIIDNDYLFKNRLSAQLKLENKFTGLPKIHLFLNGEMMDFFRIKKDILYQKVIEEDRFKDQGTSYYQIIPL